MASPSAQRRQAMKVPDDQLGTMLGVASVTFKQNEQRLAIIDSPLKA